MIRSIRVEGFKSIASETVELGRVNCFIGANGVGKSNLLEAIGILGAAASGKVDDEAIVRRGVRAGLPRLYKTAFSDQRIRPHITLEANGDSGATYCVSLLNPLDDPKPAWSFKTEVLKDDSAKFVSRGVRGEKENLLETAGLAALKVVEMAPDGAAANLLRTLQDYAVYCPNTPCLRGTVPDTQMRPPVGLSGGGLAEGLQELQKNEIVYGGHLDSAYELIDWASDIDATEEAGSLLSPAVTRGKTVLRFTDRFMEANRNTLTAYDASEGALYLLFSAVLCLSPWSPSLFAIDDMDQALNPRLMARLAGRLIEWLKVGEAQLLFTAHNPAVVDGLDLTDDDVRLFAVERNSDGHTCVRRVTLSDELLRLNKEYPLSRLWMMGHLGAVPNV
jgi:energy-coupling factor transporter ATP-binding protein EcfA2